MSGAIEVCKRFQEENVRCHKGYIKVPIDRFHMGKSG